MSQNIEQFGKYLLLEKLASGGMAEVYLAKSTGAGGVNKFLAIKRILPQFSDNPEFIEMFKEEAKIAVNLNHGNVVSIYDFGIQRGQFFIVMEYVEGKNLRQIVNDLKKGSLQLSIENIAYVIKEVAAGLDHAHRCIDGSTGKPLNITHRDMSPQNVMVSYEGEVKVIDFGIAKAETQMEVTRAGTLKGKFGYMSPEQADGQPIDLRTDIFSLGIVLWELLASERLFSGTNEAAILRKIKDCQIPNIRKLNPAVPPELERIVNKALAKDRNLRYQTASALHRDLNKFLNTQYPDFSPQDFSLFVKNAFASQFKEIKQKLVEYSRYQSVSEEKTLVTQTISAATVTLSEPAAESDNLLELNPDTGVQINLKDLKKDPKIQKTTPPRAAVSGFPTGTKTGITPTSSVTNRTSVGLHNSGLHQTQVSNDKSSKWLTRVAIVLIISGIGWIGYNRFIANSKVTSSVNDQAEQSQPVKVNQILPPPTTQDFTSKVEYKLSILTDPPGARIYLNGKDTGAFTPYQLNVEGNTPLHFTFTKEGYNTFEINKTISQDSDTLRAQLLALQKPGFLTIKVVNGGTNPAIEVDGQRLYTNPPIINYPIRANSAVRVWAKNPFLQAEAEQIVTVESNTRKEIELVLMKRVEDGKPKKSKR